jgi:hypothetical protein
MVLLLFGMSCIPTLLGGLKVNDQRFGDKHSDVNVVKTYPNAMAKFTHLFIRRESFSKKILYMFFFTSHWLV